MSAWDKLNIILTLACTPKNTFYLCLHGLPCLWFVFLELLQPSMQKGCGPGQAGQLTQSQSKAQKFLS